MVYILYFLFWLSVSAILFSYLFYPLILHFITSGKSLQTTKYGIEEEWPRIFILMAVYNEENVIQEKIESVLNSTYPYGKFYLFTASDQSNDKTDEIIRGLVEKDNRIFFFRMEARTGKSGILNFLHQKVISTFAPTTNDVYILTDANVIFEKFTIYELSRHFKDEQIGLAAAAIINRNVSKKGISREEQAYIMRENQIKEMEGIAFGATIGAFGACYALRASLYEEIPPNFLMEDFYLSMRVLEQNYKAVTDLNATAQEDVPESVFEEFKRKTRISAGNYQNLGRFMHLLTGNRKGAAFAFFSHKVLRWLTPFFLLIAIITSGILGTDSTFYSFIFLLQAVLILITVLDIGLQFAKIKIPGVRFVSYFYLMNLALLLGFFKYLKGVKTNVWQPTTRNT